MPLVILLLPIAALALYLYSSNADANAFESAADIPLPDEPGAPSLPDYAVGLLTSVGDAVTSAGSALTRGLRNNNPGNIRDTQTAWQGVVGNDGVFEIFATPGDGIRAIGKTLQNYQTKYGLNTVQGLISRWAPSTENNTSAYVNAVAAALGVSPTTPIDVQDVATRTALTAAIIKHENGRNPFDTAMITANITRS